jgi:hypothetical protein
MSDLRSDRREYDMAAQEGLHRWSRKIADEMPPKRGERLLAHVHAAEVCSFDQAGLDIIAKSTYTTHNRYSPHRAVRISNIVNDFFDRDHFQSKVVIEFGPGHYNFALVARYLGATVICVDRDPIFIELGRHLGFRVIGKDFYAVTPDDIGAEVDGVWIKGAFNAARLGDKRKVAGFISFLNRILRPQGWGWCVTVNRVRDQDTDPAMMLRLKQWVECQRECFEEHGWRSSPIEQGDRKRYALSYSGSEYYFTRGLTQS